MSSSTAALRSSWRKVSSTDNLQAFSADGHGRAVSGDQSSEQTKLMGLCMIVLASTLLTIEVAVLLVKLLPPMKIRLLSVLQQDQYYVYLVPLMVPMVLVAVTTNWFSLKLFKHNS